MKRTQFLQSAFFFLVALLIISSTGCDSSETKSQCAVLGEENHSGSVAFLDSHGAIVAQFELQQKITTYETGDCERPSTNDDGVRLVVRNLTTCALDLDYSLSVFEGSNGWTIQKTTSVARGAAYDVGIIYRGTGSNPRIDVSQMILTGSVVRSGCV